MRTSFPATALAGVALAALTLSECAPAPETTNSPACNSQLRLNLEFRKEPHAVPSYPRKCFPD